MDNLKYSDEPENEAFIQAIKVIKKSQPISVVYQMFYALLLVHNEKIEDVNEIFELTYDYERRVPNLRKKIHEKLVDLKFDKKILKRLEVRVLP